ncbi:MAG TPA: SpoIIE family protein phosphatase [Gemmatimonadales bacterium]|nr:SpoIIE family protein phosphatase [Gemmatimonadales bacterium]
MSARPNQRGLSAQDLEAILAVTSKLAAPFDLHTMLTEVMSAAKQVLGAEGGSVWLYDASRDELLLEVATGIEPIRVPAGTGLVGACARSRRLINVPDCYADERFNPEVDRRSGFRTRCMLTLPLVDHKEVLVGVMQVLNKVGGVFDHDDEELATALAAQCAVALQRVRMTLELIEGEKLRQELEMARVVQQGTLPATMPEVPGYDVHGTFQPAGLTGGDTFDLALLEQGLLVVLADATGHGIAPALSVTQMQAMIRIAFRLGASLETAFTQVNNQLAATLPPDRFITAFIGLLDAGANRLRFHSGGQGPILHFRAATGECVRHKPTSFPLAAMPVTSLRPAVTIELAPGDLVLLLSDGIYEYRNADGEEFGEERVSALARDHHALPMRELSDRLLAEVRAFAKGAPQEDDMTIVMLKRESGSARAHRSFARRIDAIAAIFDFTSEFFSRHGVDRRLLGAVDLALEELFTNMVKYGGGSGADVRIGLATVEGGVEVSLTDTGVEPFDITQAPDVDIHAPIDRRAPGGLGLHLVRRLVDHIGYEYEKESRQSRITFRKTIAEPPAGAH